MSPYHNSGRKIVIGVPADGLATQYSPPIAYRYPLADGKPQAWKTPNDFDMAQGWCRMWRHQMSDSIATAHCQTIDALANQFLLSSIRPLGSAGVSGLCASLQLATSTPG
jgi:hypothetical protein